MDSLLVDIYQGDGDFNVESLVAAGAPWCGVMAKVTQGTYYNGGEWLEKMWPRIRAAGGDRYGVDWFRCGFLYVDIALDGVKQAEYYLQRLSKVGGQGHGDLCPVIDVERGGQKVPPTHQRIIDVGAACADKLRAELGQDVICYGGELLRSTGVTIADLKCSYGWVGRYSADLPASHYESIGCDLEHLFAWQYAGLAGDGHVDAFLRGYPAVTPAGKADVSALLLAGGGPAAVAAARDRMCVASAP